MLYLDASALVKRYLKEEASDLLVSAMEGASGWTICESAMWRPPAATIAGGRRSSKKAEVDWLSFDLVEVDTALAEHAAQLALGAELRSLDALHLAAALLLAPEDLTLATWDLRLHQAARDQGLVTFPAALD
jgi:uncharacterized protein